MSLEVPVHFLPHGLNLPLPSHQTPDSAGLDLMAAIPIEEPLVLLPRQRRLVPTGLCLALPRGYEGQVRPRSGLALKHGVTVLNAPGTVDSDYRGEVGVVLINHGEEPFEITRGMRIAQLVVAPVNQVALIRVESLSETDRGTGGYGSTGHK